jgi:iron complex outermembrane receptor protein
MKKLYTILLLILSVSLYAPLLFAQSKTGNIAGAVKTSDGKPAAYVSVGLAGTNKGTTADEDGKYELKNIKPGSYTLKVSFVGLKTQEGPVTVTADNTSRVFFNKTENSSKQK